MRRDDRRAYNREKKRVVEAILDVVEARYVPRLREHLSLRVAGTPATNERFCRAPLGNSYGAALVPANVGPGRGPYRSAVENLWLANATAGMPSVAGAIGAGARLFEELSA
jgi:phytoene dehydrogenase-like protein